MPEVTREEMGRRLFMVRKEKAVESAIDIIRQKLGQDGITIPVSDIEALQGILGEMWVLLSRSTWEQYSFSRLKKADITEIISIGRGWREKKLTEQQAVDAFNRIFSR